jgi:hypothetical protein
MTLSLTMTDHRTDTSNLVLNLLALPVAGAVDEAA